MVESSQRIDPGGGEGVGGEVGVLGGGGEGGGYATLFTPSVASKMDGVTILLASRLGRHLPRLNRCVRKRIKFCNLWHYEIGLSFRNS